mmetsp:Transcript_14112/g.21665  ORF Transcript_14112/g.21665 Transcript_14112/m.21665 type:complete len:81 (-) Transcript_14112:168-410(-)
MMRICKVSLPLAFEIALRGFWIRLLLLNWEKNTIKSIPTFWMIKASILMGNRFRRRFRFEIPYANYCPSGVLVVALAIAG